jgi:uncharacterized membrane protein
MTASPPDRREVPPYVALVRIAAVIGMSMAIATGICLILLSPTTYLLWGLLSIALAVPCFGLMRLAERMAEPSGPPRAG